MEGRFTPDLMLGECELLDWDIADHAASRTLDGLVPLATPLPQLSPSEDGDMVDAFLNSRDDADLEWDEEMAIEMTGLLNSCLASADTHQIAPLTSLAGCDRSARSAPVLADQLLTSCHNGAETPQVAVRPAAPVLVKLSRPVLIVDGPPMRLPMHSRLSPEAQLKHKGWAKKRKIRVKYGRKHVYTNKRDIAKSRRRANGKFESRELAEARTRELVEARARGLTRVSTPFII